MKVNALAISALFGAAFAQGDAPTTFATSLRPSGGAPPSGAPSGFPSGFPSGPRPSGSGGFGGGPRPTGAPSGSPSGHAHVVAAAACMFKCSQTVMFRKAS